MHDLPKIRVGQAHTTKNYVALTLKGFVLSSMNILH